MIRKCRVTGFFPRMRNLHDPPQIQCGIYLAPPPNPIRNLHAPPPHFPAPPNTFQMNTPLQD